MDFSLMLWERLRTRAPEFCKECDINLVDIGGLCYDCYEKWVESKLE
jgi:hypothetical protein